jgi:hypothetical protein
MSSAARAQSVDWFKQIGTDGTNVSRGVSADRMGHFYITGSTEDSLGGPSGGSSDAFIGKYDNAGNALWFRQLGTASSDDGYCVSADSIGNVYISGGTAGSLGRPNPGVSDVFVSKFDGAGNLIWTRQFGAALLNDSRGISAGSDGNVYVAGSTYPTFRGSRRQFLVNSGGRSAHEP